MAHRSISASARRIQSRDDIAVLEKVKMGAEVYRDLSILNRYSQPTESKTLATVIRPGEDTCSVKHDWHWIREIHLATLDRNDRHPVSEQTKRSFRSWL